jgi:hypothetical protein
MGSSRLYQGKRRSIMLASSEPTKCGIVYSFSTSAPYYDIENSEEINVSLFE